MNGLAASTSYSFFVRAVDAAGNVSTSSNTVAVTTPGNPGGGGGTPTVVITNDWGNGYCATLIVLNETGSLITWQVSITIQGIITNLWNGTYTQTGSTVTVSGVEWNGTLQPGQSTNSVGFCAAR